METLAKRFQAGATRAIQAAFPEVDLPAEVTPSTNEQFGHYQCNSAMRLAKMLKMNPREVAAQIIDHFTDEAIEKIEIAGPGFINITLNGEALSQDLTQMAADNRLGISLPKTKQRVIVEFSSPNVAKELHVGHLRSTVIGDSIARLFEFLGHDVVRLNHIGDWGTQFGMLICYLKEFHPHIITGDEEADLPTLMHWYREAKKLFDADADFKDRSRLEVVHLQGGDGTSRKAWEAICDISRKAYQEIYHLLDIKLHERGESFYNAMLKPIVNTLKEQGMAVMSEGATCIFLDGFETPMIIQKTDGGFTYHTTDLAAMKHRTEEEKADRIIVVTDAGQSLHFQLLEQACITSGILDPKRTHFDHVTFGVVLGPDGKKFKTRSGETERLIDLLQTAIDRAKAIMSERDVQGDIDKLSTILAIDAVKYADLSCLRTKDYTFSYDKMLRFEGNTAAFLLYSYVRIQGIKRKVGKPTGDAPISLTHPSEISLGFHLRRFPEVLEMMTRDLLPNRLCDYLYDLAERFNAFFRDCRVEGTPEEASRLRLCDLTARILEQGLHILGLQTMDRM